MTEPRHLLPPAAYSDPAWLERERRELFGACWLFAGLEAELREPGQYKTVNAGSSQLLIVRTRDGSLNAFHNVCRHRGARLAEGAGTCSTFTCPYHRWSFGLDGRLRGVPQRDQYPHFDFDTHGLFPASVGVSHGLVFVHTNPQPDVSLVDWLGSLATVFDVFKPQDIDEIARQSFDFDANWKLYLENHIDWLHLWYLHEDTLGGFDHEHGRMAQHGPHWASFEIPKPDTDFSDTERPLTVLPHMQDADPYHQAIGAHLLFPNVALFSGRDYFMTAELTPLAPNRTRMDMRLLGLPGGNTDAFFERFYEITKGEDVVMIENIQRNVGGARFEVGPLARTYEQPIAEFHRHYASFVSLP